MSIPSRLFPTSSQYSNLKQRADALRSMKDDHVMWANIAMDESDVDHFKGLTYVLVREYGVVDEAAKEALKERDKLLGERESVIAGLEEHIRDLSRHIIGLTSRR
jgi:hypothetical protein